ncbi:MAG: hypothetical protein ISS43_00140 [Candidatus Omnitrophica bacterium]|nr:hypothetical protein [Candidatus Omnitrophota bacterium]
MKKQRFFGFTTFLLLTIFCFPTSIFAETVILKSREKIEGTITEKTDEYITIDFYGASLRYYLEDIESIDGEKLALSSAKEETVSPDAGYAQEGEYYINEGYGIRIWCPKELVIFDRKTHPDLFRALLEAAQSRPDINATPICALGRGNNLNDSNPIIMITVEQLQDDSGDLATEDMVELLNETFKQASLPAGTSIVKYPSLLTINGKKFVNFATVAQGGKVKAMGYQFIKARKLYIISCSAKSDTFDAYKAVFKNIAGSIEVY